MTFRIDLSVLALVLGSPGCSGKDYCPEPSSPPPGTYTYVGSDKGWLGGSTAVVDDTTVTITYTAKDGSRWKATYAIGGPL